MVAVSVEGLLDLFIGEKEINIYYFINVPLSVFIK